MSSPIEGGALIRGIWFPRGEQHLADMLGKSKIGDVDGRGTYQLHKLRAAMQYVSGFERAVDVGSHVGLWAMHLAPLFKHVDAFEPIPLHRECFEANMADVDNYTLYPVALGREAGEVDLEWTPNDTGRTHIVSKGAHASEFKTEQIHAEIRTLDSYGLTGVDFIKIDVEGVEFDVVSGATETIVNCRPVMVVEQKGNDQKTFGRERDEAVKYLHDLGMKSARVMAGDHILVWE